jgi:PHD/YefM family antitoxin component YafN of YafNO toxin-antitoxin module
MDSKKQRDSWVETLTLINKENVERLKAIEKQNKK